MRLAFALPRQSVAALSGLLYAMSPRQNNAGPPYHDCAKRERKENHSASTERAPGLGRQRPLAWVAIELINRCQNHPPSARRMHDPNRTDVLLGRQAKTE